MTAIIVGLVVVILLGLGYMLIHKDDENLTPPKPAHPPSPVAMYKRKVFQWATT